MMKNGIIILGFILLVAFGYYLFVLSDNGLEIGNRATVSQAELETQAFLRRLTSLRSIDLQVEVFDRPSFTNRIDYSRPVPVLPVGRENPFVPAQ